MTEDTWITVLRSVLTVVGCCATVVAMWHAYGWLVGMLTLVLFVSIN